jgi:uracil-DNA glycosylase family 4
MTTLSLNSLLGQDNKILTCPNRFPLLAPSTHRLAVIGEAPGDDEINCTKTHGNQTIPDPQPFVGSAGRLLRGVLAQTGISCDQILFAHVCQHRPPGNDISTLDWDGVEVQIGIQRLLADLEVFKPHCCLLVGKAPLRLFRPDLVGSSSEVPLGSVRGSIFSALGYKAVATFHPSYVLRAYGDIPYFKFDVHRAVRQSTFPELRSISRVGNLTPSLSDVLTFCDRVRANRTELSFDVEGYVDDLGITCFSLCDTPVSGIVIPLWHKGTHYWSEEEEVQIWSAVAKLLADPSVPKTAHNAFYELFMFMWRHRCLIRNLAHDTMMLCWEAAPELERGLGVVASIYTEEPFYKDERLSNDPHVKLNYNFKDSAVTKEIRDVVLPKLPPASRSHYDFNIRLIPPVTYLHLRGCRFDSAKAQELREKTELEVAGLNQQIQSALGRPFNVKSTPDKQWLLYDHLGLKPSQRHGKKTSEDILLGYWSKTQHDIIRLVIQCVRKRTYLSDINKLTTNEDGRIRSSYDLVGTNTGRLSSRASQALRLVREELKKSVKIYWDETGTNLQNVTKDLRVCFIPDSSDHDFWQFDLSGADGWTVGADLAALGHPQMLEDYLAGIKPALVLNLMLREYEAKRDPAQINLLPRDEIKRRCKALKADYDSHSGEKDSLGRDYDWQYFVCKKIQHGSNYGARPEKIAELVFVDSDAQITVSAKDAGLYQYFYKLRYKTDVRNEWIRRELSDKGYLIAACGIKRQFFNIRNRRDIDDAVVREASSFEPQANTTWATNKALERLWYDPTNRTSRGGLFIEPLLQIHDALAGQYRVKHRDWAGQKLKEWFANPLTIHGIPITIPAEGNRGDSWKNCNERI